LTLAVGARGELPAVQARKILEVEDGDHVVALLRSDRD